MMYAITLKTIILALGLPLVAATSVRAYDHDVALQAWLDVSAVEQRHDIPHGLLHAMSLAESGKALEGQLLPWPYTVGVNPTRNYTLPNATAAQAKLEHLQKIGFTRFNVQVNGKTLHRLSASAVQQRIQAVKGQVKLRGLHFARRFANHAAATHFAEEKIALGYDNLDLGLMQINWHWHKSAFTNVAEALDVQANASYAVTYLKKHRATRNWWDSVGRYHSGTPTYAKRYIQRVYAMYQKIHRI